MGIIKGVDLVKREAEERLGGIEEMETVVRIYYVRKLVSQ